MTCLPAAPHPEHSGGSSRQGWDTQQCWGTGGPALLSHVEKLFCTSQYGPHLKKPKQRAGSTGNACSPHCTSRVGMGPGSSLGRTEQEPWMPEQDHCPACAWGPPLPSIFPPVLTGASHHLPPGCSVLATTAAHHTIPITCPSCHHPVPRTCPSCPLCCPHGKPNMLPQHSPGRRHPPPCKWLQRALNHPC